jgi:hypothetical protein
MVITSQDWCFWEIRGVGLIGLRVYVLSFLIASSSMFICSMLIQICTSSRSKVPKLSFISYEVCSFLAC